MTVPRDGLRDAYLRSIRSLASCGLLNESAAQRPGLGRRENDGPAETVGVDRRCLYRLLGHDNNAMDPVSDTDAAVAVEAGERELDGPRGSGLGGYGVALTADHGRTSANSPDSG